MSSAYLFGDTKLQKLSLEHCRRVCVCVCVCASACVGGIFVYKDSTERIVNTPHHIKQNLKNPQSLVYQGYQ